MTEAFCEHGYRHGKRCPMCGQPESGEKPAKRRSVWDDRELDGGVGRADWWREMQFRSIGIPYTEGWRRWP